MVKSSPLKCKFFWFSSARVKIRQIPHANFETASQFLFEFCIIFIVMTHYWPVNFKLIHFLLWIKGSHESPNFETFEFSGENLPNSSCDFWKRNSAFLQMLHQSLVPSNITPSSNIVYLVKGSPLKGISLRFLSVWVKLRLNFSCQFWTGRYIPLQILHHSPVSWKITYLHFSNSKILYISSSVKLLNCSRRGATIYYIVSARHHQLKAD